MKLNSKIAMVAGIATIAASALTSCGKSDVKPIKASAYKSAPVYTGPDSSGNGHPPIPPK